MDLVGFEPHAHGQNSRRPCSSTKLQILIKYDNDFLYKIY